MTLTLVPPGIDVKKSIELINATALELVKDIRNFSVFQRDIWQTIPYLALEAEGRTGYSEDYQWAYSRGLWSIGASRENGLGSRVFVDLDSGALVANPPTHDRKKPLEPARDKDILKIALSIDQLNAAKVAQALKEKAAQPYPSYMNAQGSDKHREEMRQRFNVQEIYVRSG